jgi:peptidoglycan/LPS O-acetylase OafA/YrhL
MFGTYRTILALAVVATHLLRIPSLGPHAVHGFFILSGYLMTTVMHRSYGYSMHGIGSFALNRFLRLYPGYWAILILILISCALFGWDKINNFHSAIAMPKSQEEWIQNLSLIFFASVPMEVTPRLAPPTWALTVELFYYVLIACGVSKTRLRTLLWFAASMGYTLYTHLAELGYDSRYTHLAAGSLPFSIGALIFHYQDHLKKHGESLAGTVSLLFIGAAFFANGLAAAVSKHFLHSELLQSFFFYMNLPINFFAVTLLMTKPKLPISYKIDKMIGDFSYPLYLCHWQCGFVASMLLFNNPARGLTIQGIVSFLIAILLCAIVSLLIIRYVDRPVEMVRSRIKEALWKKAID